MGAASLIAGDVWTRYNHRYKSLSRAIWLQQEVLSRVSDDDRVVGALPLHLAAPGDRPSRPVGGATG